MQKMAVSTYILGISCFYHDSAASLIKDGEVLAAAQEERFTRVRHDSSFPINAIKFLLRQANITIEDIQIVAYYDKPFITFERLLESHLATAPKGLQLYLKTIPVWLSRKLDIKGEIKRNLKSLRKNKRSKLPELLFSAHHQSHAASAFYPSPFHDAAVLCVDGVGEWATTSLWQGHDTKLTPIKELHFPHSLGLLYSSFTQYLGFKVDSGEYKLMGLAPYGRPKYAKKIRDELIDLKDDGSFRLNMTYFGYLESTQMIHSKFTQLFGQPCRKPETRFSEFHCDIAASIQEVTNQAMIRLASHARSVTGQKNLTLAGGVALNCVANTQVFQKAGFEQVWIQPAAGDAGGSIGSAYLAWHQHLKQPMKKKDKDQMQGAQLGPDFGREQIFQAVTASNLVYEELSDSDLTEQVSNELVKQSVVGWFQGRMEFGPRALGQRSLLGDPRSPSMQDQMNLKIKFRESFRPFAPSVLAEKAADFFEEPSISPYMLFTAKVKKSTAAEPGQSLNDQRKSLTSDYPAITHVDTSARLQTVDKDISPKYHQLLESFFKKTGCPMLINTSFNLRGEPIVCTPQDAINCFMNSNIDVLVLENFVIHKSRQTEPVYHKYQQDLAPD